MHRELRQSIEDGSYTVDPELVAEAMIVHMRADRASAMFVAPQPLDWAAVRVQKGDTAPGLD